MMNFMGSQKRDEASRRFKNPCDEGIGVNRKMEITSGHGLGAFEVFLPSHSAARKPQRQGDDGYPGRLFIVEGIDGSGKSTQLDLLHKWLESKGYGVVFSEWNSSPLVKDTTKFGKKKRC
jgi:Thymidylate kinase